MRSIALALAFALALAGAAEARPRGGGGATTVASQASTSVSVTWSSGSASASTLACGTAYGSYTINAVDAGTQTSVTSHSGILAGLTPATRYYCQAKSGATVTGEFSFFTEAALATTPIVSVTYGTTARPSGTSSNSLDTIYSCASNDGTTYVTMDDANPGIGGSGSMNMGVGKFTDDTTMAASNVNTLASFGAQNAAFGDGYTMKFSGIGCVGGALYGYYERQLTTASPQTHIAGALMKSTDHGATWVNWQGASSTTGPALSPVNASFWGTTSSGSWAAFANGSSNFASPTQVTYGADSGGLGYRVDNADAYVYAFSADGLSGGGLGSGSAWQNNDSLLLARVPKAKLANLSGADWQYYTAVGGDGSKDAAWSGNFSLATPIISSAGKISFSAINYLPALNRYIAFTWYYPTLGGASTTPTTEWVTYEAPHPWGPWTAVSALGACNSILSTTTCHWTTTGWYNPVPTVRSVLAMKPDNASFPLTVLHSGDYLNGAATYYHLWAMPVTINTH